MDQKELEQLNNVLNLWNILEFDVQNTSPTEEDVEGSDSEFKSQMKMRSYVRAVFSFIEGVTYSFKQALLVSPRISVLEIEERVILKEVTVELDDEGKTKSRDVFLRTKGNVRFTLEMWQKVHSTSYQIDFGDNNWRIFGQSIGIRNRIVHPKSVQDAAVSPLDFATAGLAYSWFSRNSHHLLMDTLTPLQRELGVTAKELELRRKKIDMEHELFSGLFKLVKETKEKGLPFETKGLDKKYAEVEELTEEILLLTIKRFENRKR